MRVPGHIFREYDIRGVVATDLTAEFVEGLGRAIGTTLRRQGLSKIAVGRDVRASGERLFADLSRGLLCTGCDVVDFGRLPTPVLYHGVATGGEAAGVAITGSHNPPEFNGFKLVVGSGSFYGRDIQALRELMQHDDFERGAGRLTAREVIEPYVRELAAQARIPRRVRFAYDPGNGAASLLCRQLFAAVGQDPVALFDEPDGSFPNHHPDPTQPENMQDLRRAVLAQGLELGIAYDGDADRIGVVDDRGEILWGDQLLILYARDLLSRKPGSQVIFDVKCSQTLPDAIERAGGRPLIWKTGHSLIKSKMKETGALLAGEMSGHMFFGEDYYGFDDAILATLRLLSIVARDERPLSRQLADVPRMAATPELRIDCPDEQKFEVVEIVKRELADAYSIVDIDGVRVLFERGWGLVRASNTQPALVMRVEAQSASDRDEYQGRLEASVARARRRVESGN